MAATRLSLYNDALLLAGERSLASLTEANEPRRLLDQIWANQGVDACLEEGQWEFAMRTVMINYDPGITPSFGYNRAFGKPTDWVLTSALCSDEFFRVPLLQYSDEASYWYASIDTLYVRFVSNGTTYGADMSLWPPSFKDFVAAHFASQLVLKTSNDESRLRMFVNPENPEHSIRGRALLKAKSRCAMASATQFPAQGGWSRARTRGFGTRDGGGNNGSLIG